MSRTQAEIDRDRRTMAQEIVDAQRLENLDDAKRFARGWIETAAQHADNEAYYHVERDALLQLLVEARPYLFKMIGPTITTLNALVAHVDAKIRGAERLLEPQSRK